MDDGHFIEVFGSSIPSSTKEKTLSNFDPSDKFLRIASANIVVKPHSQCAGVATVHADAGQPVYRDAPGHIS